MSKRRAGNELTRDNWDKEEEKVEAGVFQVANESILKNQIIKKAVSGLKTNTFNITMASEGSPQVSSYENTEKRLKDKDEVKNNSVNIEDSSISFTSPKNNSINNGPLIKFGISSDNTVTNINDISKSNSKIEEMNDKDEEEKIEPKSQEESKDKPITTGGFKFGDFKFNQQSFSIPLTSTSSESVFNDKKTSPFKNIEFKFNSTPLTNFGTVPKFSLTSLEQQKDKPFFSFGSKLPAYETLNSDVTKISETQKSKDKEDKDQPPIKENDAIFESKSKVYCLKNSKYEELGIGQLYLKQVGDKKIQLIMRNDSALGTIMINTLLNESINFTKRNTKTIQLICILDPTKSTKPQIVLFKFKDSQITDSFENELNKLKK